VSDELRYPCRCYWRTAWKNHRLFNQPGLCQSANYGFYYMVGPGATKAQAKKEEAPSSFNKREEKTICRKSGRNCLNSAKGKKTHQGSLPKSGNYFW